MKYTEHLSTIAVRTLSILMTTGILLAGCERQEQESLAPGSGDNAGSGKQVTFSIRLQGVPEYNAPDGETRGTRSGEPLISEWVKVNSFDATRPVEEPGEVAAGNESGGPRIALMELREDTVSVRPATRGIMPAGYTFRVIAFLKTSAGYEFQSVADYISKGTATPELKRGEIYLSVGQKYRFIAYSFNNAEAIADPVTKNYVWNVTSISIPDLNNDFMTYDSGDQTVSGENFTLPVSFTQQLCKLTVKISATGFADNTFTNCTGVYIEQGGNSSSWTPGASGVTASTNNSDPFSIPDNSSTTSVLLVPFASLRFVTVHFSTLTVGGRDAGNRDITSSHEVQLKGGKSYTLTVQFKKSIGINVSINNIKLGIPTCTQADKELLSKLLWAEGNIIGNGSGNTNDYEWTTNPTDYGYYYTWTSTYTAGTGTNGIDPCNKLKTDIYGSNWHTPTQEEMESLSHCTNKNEAVENNTKGLWFMAEHNGLFLPFAGARSSSEGCGTEGASRGGQTGYYWSNTGKTGTNNAFFLMTENNSSRVSNLPKTYGFSVRCVKNLQ